MEFSVTTACADDADAVSTVLQASYPDLLKPFYDADVLQAALPLMLRANPRLLACGTYYVARTQDGLAVGCGGWTREKPGTVEIAPGLGHLRHFGTHREWNGRGIGRRIYAVCEAEARSAGVRAFEVWASLNAAPFYQSLGFARIERITIDFAPGVAFPSLVMRRAL